MGQQVLSPLGPRRRRRRSVPESDANPVGISCGSSRNRDERSATDMGAVNDRLAEIAQQMQEQSAKGAVPTPHEITPRELVRLYGYERRGASVNSRIRNDLEQVNLRVVPDFEFQYADSNILIELDQEADGSPSSGQPSDPTYRVGTLEAANNKPVSVKPDNALEIRTETPCWEEGFGQ